MTRVIHIVAAGYQSGPFMRQVCAWCGAKLIDEDLRLIASPDGRGMSFWPEGKLLVAEEHGGFRSWTVLEQDPAGSPPADACFAPPLPPPPKLEVVR